jgi:hypothetical protein
LRNSSEGTNAAAQGKVLSLINAKHTPRVSAAFLQPATPTLCAAGNSTGARPLRVFEPLLRRPFYDLTSFLHFSPYSRLLQGNEQLTMAAGFDELVDFLLSEIALCGVQGMPDPLHHFFFLFTQLSIFFMSVHSSLSVAAACCNSLFHDGCSLRQYRIAGEPYR